MNIIENVSRRSFFFLAFVILAQQCFVLTESAHAQTKANDVYQKSASSIVLIRTDKAVGTGFIVASNGVIATALHVVDGATRVAIKTALGDIYDNVSLLAKDERRDLAILKVTGFDFSFVKLGNSNDIKPGDQVIVIGNPLGAEQLQTSITDGIISGIRDLGDGYKVIQMTASVSPGNSGGPAFSSNGDVIGVVVFKLRDGESLNFAVPINYIRGMLEAADGSKPISKWSNSPGVEGVFTEKVSSKTTRWKSMSWGATYLVRVDGDYLYAERIFSEEDHKLGNSVVYELKKQGDKYVGTDREHLVWWKTYFALPNEKFVTDRCAWETQVEISLVTPSRIEGRGLFEPKGAKFDKKKCLWSKPLEWLPFVWIPE
jgi:hypothetical protein